MKFVVRKLPVTEIDTFKVAEWYDEKEPGLGEAFVDDLDLTFELLVKNPSIYSIRFSDVRCIRLRRFVKYGVFYVVNGNEIVVLAIHHGARNTHWMQERR